MATNALQFQAAQAKPLTLFDAGNCLEELLGDAEELSSLLLLVSESKEIDDRMHRALRAVSTLADAMGRKCEEKAAEFFTANTAARRQSEIE